MLLKPWRETAIPHEDVLKGTVQQAEFAADISRVHDGTAVPEYGDPVQFFARTFIPSANAVVAPKTPASTTNSSPPGPESNQPQTLLAVLAPKKVSISESELSNDRQTEN